jgi:hypothetical protein
LEVAIGVVLPGNPVTVSATTVPHYPANFLRAYTSRPIPLFYRFPAPGQVAVFLSRSVCQHRFPAEARPLPPAFYQFFRHSLPPLPTEKLAALLKTGPEFLDLARLCPLCPAFRARNGTRPVGVGK